MKRFLESDDYTYICSVQVTSCITKATILFLKFDFSLIVNSAIVDTLTMLV